MYVRSDTGNVIEIFFGNGWGRGRLDNIPEDEEIMLEKQRAVMSALYG